MPKCWVIGSAVVDHVYSVPRLPQSGESVLATSVARFLGGKGVNQAIAAARSGAEVAVIGCLGQDAAGDEFLALLQAEGIDTTLISRSNNSPTGSASISIDPSGRNQITVHPGANMDLHANLVRQANIHQEDFVLCQLEVPDQVVIAASERGRFFLNPAPYREFPQSILRRCLAVTPNETEAKALTGFDPRSDPERCAAALLELGTQTVILTLGDQGALMFDGKTWISTLAPRVDAVDTTAAGDVLNGALIARLAIGDDFPNALNYAVHAATVSVTRFGAIPSIPTNEQVKTFFRNPEPVIENR
jgi:ribokinase